jgi:4-amino-4-deoxy-L-arabinose transferase-like glycosyltransferase
VAWAALIILASSPFAARYATEARMYSLVVLLTLVGGLALAELLERRSTRAALGLGVASGLLLYTHYWSFYLLGTVALVLLVGAARGRRPDGARRSMAAMAAGGLLFLPWLPTFLHQLRNTGTPWGTPGNLRSFFDTVTHFAGGYWDFGLALGLVYFALIALGLVGRGVDGGRIELDLRGHDTGRFLGAVVLGTLAVAVVAGRLGGSAFAVRYAAVVLPALILLMALGAAVFTSPRAYRTVLGLVAVLGFAACVPNVVGERTTAARVAAALRAQASPGDIVAYCPDQLGPSVTRQLPADNGLDHVTFPRPRPPQFVDWVGYAAATRAASPPDFARMLLERAGSRDIWVVWAPGYRLFKAKCQALLSELNEVRPDNTRVVKVSTQRFERPGLARFRP